MTLTNINTFKIKNDIQKKLCENLGTPYIVYRETKHIH